MMMSVITMPSIPDLSNPITSAQNSQIKLAKGLLASNRQRNKHQQSIIEGTHLLSAAFKADHPIEQILLAASQQHHPEVMQLLHTAWHKGIATTTVSDELYRSLSNLGTGIDIMAVIPIRQLSIRQISGDCLILNDVQDAGNVGTLLRTAAAVGVTNVICTTGTAQVWSPKTLRAGMGAQFALMVYENVLIADILAHVHTPMLATSSHTDAIIYKTDLQTPVAWVMGHEGQGVCDELMQHATPIALPQPNGQESLNVAIAGSLCLYEMLRQRQFA